MGNKKQILRKYEERIFKYGIAISFILILIRLVHEMIIGSTIEMIGIYLALTFIIGYIYFLHSRKYQLATVIYYLLGAIGHFILWNTNGGWDGPILYSFFLFVVFVIITSHKWVLIVTISILMLGLLIIDKITFLGLNNNYQASSLVFDFIISTVALIAITYSLKIFFFREKKQYEKINAQLAFMTSRLSLQGQLLTHQNEEMNKTKTNQENLVQSTYLEVQESGKLLQEYNFTNSHIIRAPLSNILGLINLLEQEHSNHPEIDTFRKMMIEAKRMDAIIRNATNSVESSRMTS